MKADPRRPLDPNLEIIASYIQPDDVIVDVGGGAGRISLPLALRCREGINVEPSIATGAGFRANADQAGISNARVVGRAPSAVGRSSAGTLVFDRMDTISSDDAAQ
jgi:precorrin-6B methylase 2